MQASPPHPFSSAVPGPANFAPYEIGLVVSDGAPHTISRTVELIGGDGQPLRRQPEDGDELLAVNETDVTRVESLRQVPDLMMGPEGSVAKLTIRTRSKETIHMHVRRLVPSRIWRLYKQASDELPALKIALGEARWAVAPGGQNTELLGEEESNLNATTMGLQVDTSSIFPNTAIKVQRVLDGSPAQVHGLLPGDSLLKINNVEVNAGNIERLLHPPRAQIGSMCPVQYARGGQAKMCHLSHSSLARVCMTEKLLQLIASLKKSAAEAAPVAVFDAQVQLVKTLEQLESHARTMAAARIEGERRLSMKINGLQTDITGQLDKLQKSLEKFPAAEDVWQDLSEQAALTTAQTQRLRVQLDDIKALHKELDFAKESMAERQREAPQLRKELEKSLQNKRDLEAKMGDLKHQLEWEKNLSAKNVTAPLEKKVQELQNKINSLEMGIKQLDSENEVLRSSQDRMRWLTTQENARVQEIAGLKQKLAGFEAVNYYCNTPPQLSITPDQLVKAFRDADVRADQLLRLMELLASRPPPAVDEVEHIVNYLNRNQVDFHALETRLDQRVLYERLITQHQPELRNLEYIVKEERKLRERVQDDFAECRKLVEASSAALQEWVPMMNALKRLPAVTPAQFAAALNAFGAPPRDVMRLLVCLSEHDCSVTEAEHVISTLWTNDSPGVESVNNLVAKISSIHAQRWRYKHLDPNSKAGKMAAFIKGKSTPIIGSASQEDPHHIEVESKRAQVEQVRLVSTYLTSNEGKSRIAEVLAFQKEYEALNGYIKDRPGQNLVAPYPHPHSPRSSPTTANPSAWDKIREKAQYVPR